MVEFGLTAFGRSREVSGRLFSILLVATPQPNN